MTKNSPNHKTAQFAANTLPWLASGLMLLLFLLTLNRGVTLGSLFPIAEISGWMPGTRYLSPLGSLLTLPGALLPASWLPLFLHMESAVCGALTIWLLARSVTLLPHDRTPVQRESEHSEHSTFSGRFCWLPPIFAVLALGLERTYWECSTEATGRMFDLLGFAWCIRCLLEYRLDENTKWFSKFAFVYGLIMANNWLMVAFFPFFVGAVIWIRGLAAFESVFIRKVLLWGAAGLCLIFLHPILNHFSPDSGDGFWGTLKTTLIADKRVIFLFPRDKALLLSLTTVLPILVISFKWATSFGDNSPFGIFLAGTMFHLANGLFFLAGIWVALDAPINPRMQLPGAGDSFLALNYLGALAIGYFTGYFLLIFGGGIFRPNPLNPLKTLVDWAVTVTVLFLVIFAPVFMLARNLPYIRAKLHLQQALRNYTVRMEKTLPPEGAVILSDDAVRLDYMRCLLTGQKRQSKFLFIDTPSLLHRTNYARILKTQNAAFPFADSWLTNGTSLFYGVSELRFLEELSRQRPIYYLHASFGHFFEMFSPEQHGLIVRLNRFPENTWDTPPVGNNLIESNKLFFDELAGNPDIALVAEKLRDDDHVKPRTFSEKLDKALRLKPEAGYFSPTISGAYSLAPLVGTYYSKSMNEWGVSLQKAGRLPEAKTLFQMATNANPANGSAKLNLLANRILSEKKKMELGDPKDVAAVLGTHFGYGEALNLNGIDDEPTFLADLGIQYAVGGNYRQSVQCLHRAMDLAQNTIPLALKLAQIQIAIQSNPNQLSRFYPYTNCYQEALTNFDYVLGLSPDYPPALFGKSVALIQMRQFAPASLTLTKFLEKEPQNTAARLNRAITYVQSDKLDAAKEDYNMVIKALPGSYPAYFGLGEIYYREKDTNNAVRNYDLYLTNAPATTQEAAFVRKRVAELKPGAP